MSKFFVEKPSAFTPALEVSTVFMEYAETLLLLKRTRCSLSPHTWGIPGGKLEKNETPLEGLLREIWEELQLSPQVEQLVFQRSLYVSHPKVDYRLHLFRWKLDKKPFIVLDPKEHVDYVWQPIKEFDAVNLLEGQLEAFKYVYAHNHV